jgi:hypothetical protein
LRNYIAIVKVAAVAALLLACGSDAGSGIGETGGNSDAGEGGAGTGGAATTGGSATTGGAATTGGSATAGTGAGGRTGTGGTGPVGGDGSAGKATAGAGAGGRAGTGGTGPVGGGGSAGKATAGAGAGGRVGAGGSAGLGGRAGAAGAGTGNTAGGGASGTGGGENPPITCEKPVFTTSDTNGGWTNGGYYVHNNVWNASEAGPETLYACAFNSWYVRSTQPNSTSVKAYPNVHLDINGLKGSPISNYTTILSTFAATSPQIGIYNVAYDLWLNGVGWGGGTTEVMIWTENHKQTPLGSVVAPQTTFGANQYDVYHYTSKSDGGVQVITLLSKTAQASGSVDLKEMLDWIVSKGWITASATVNQIGYGVEICSTDNQSATFSFSDFSVTMK